MLYAIKKMEIIYMIIYNKIKKKISNKFYKIKLHLYNLIEINTKIINIKIKLNIIYNLS